MKGTIEARYAFLVPSVSCYARATDTAQFLQMYIRIKWPRQEFEMEHGSAHILKEKQLKDGYSWKSFANKSEEREYSLDFYSKDSSNVEAAVGVP